eukprot:324110-Prymnesium_polylepis.1
MAAVRGSEGAGARRGDSPASTPATPAYRGCADRGGACACCARVGLTRHRHCTGNNHRCGAGSGLLCAIFRAPNVDAWQRVGSDATIAAPAAVCGIRAQTPAKTSCDGARLQSVPRTSVGGAPAPRRWNLLYVIVYENETQLHDYTDVVC